MESAPFSRRHLLAAGASATVGALLISALPGHAASERGTFPFRLSEKEWRARLSPAAYRVLREEDTERPWTSPLLGEKRRGVFACAGCAQPLFGSDTKYDSGTGWPSFWAELPGSVGYKVDRSLMMVRTEEHCARCGGHLGHVFEDGPPPTGRRHCINGVALAFTPSSPTKAS